MSSVSRRRFVYGATAFGASLAAGCGAAGERDAAPAGQSAKQPVTLRVNYRTEQWIVDRAKDFSAAHPWITLDLVADSGYEKLLVLAVAGDLGDVYWASG